MPTDVELLNILTPGADVTKLGTKMNQIITLLNEVRTDHATNKTMTDELHVDVDLNGAAMEDVLAKLDADAGITDTNYVATHGRSGSGNSIQAAAITATDVATITAVAVDTLSS